MSTLIGSTAIRQIAGGADGFPLAVSANGRFLTLQGGTPFLMVADSSQAAGVCNPSDFQTYVTSRAAAGFNCIQYGLIADGYVSNPDDTNYTTLDGIAPFTGARFTTPNATYFARQDTLINMVGNAGMFCWINPWQLGAAPTGSSMATDVNSASTGTLQTFFNFVANRYKSLSFVGWYFGNDYAPGSYDAKVQTIIQCFINNAPNQLRGGQLCFSQGVNLNSTNFDVSTFNSYVQCQASYPYADPYQGCLMAYNNSSVNFASLGAGTNTTPPAPVVMVEDHYEWENLFSVNGTPYVMRLQMWWEYTSGAVARVHGSHFTFCPLGVNTTAPISGYSTTSPQWLNNLNSPAVVHFGYLKAFFAAIPWYNLVPDQGNLVITAGRGTAAATAPFATHNYVSVAATADGNYAVAYIPQGSGTNTAGSLTVALTKFTGPHVQGQWFDPTAGVYTAVSGSPFTNSGTTSITAPGNNNAGDPDWVLLLRSVP